MRFPILPIVPKLKLDLFSKLAVAHDFNGIITFIVADRSSAAVELADKIEN